MLPVNFQRAVADKATVPIYYESRILELSLDADELPKLDALVGEGRSVPAPSPFRPDSNIRSLALSAALLDGQSAIGPNVTAP